MVLRNIMPKDSKKMRVAPASPSAEDSAPHTPSEHAPASPQASANADLETIFIPSFDNIDRVPQAMFYAESVARLRAMREGKTPEPFSQEAQQWYTEAVAATVAVRTELNMADGFPAQLSVQRCRFPQGECVNLQFCFRLQVASWWKVNVCRERRRRAQQYGVPTNSVTCMRLVCALCRSALTQLIARSKAVSAHAHVYRLAIIILQAFLVCQARRSLSDGACISVCGSKRWRERPDNAYDSNAAD